jgi:hypothetical protein
MTRIRRLWGAGLALAAVLWLGVPAVRADDTSGDDTGGKQTKLPAGLEYVSPKAHGFATADVAKLLKDKDIQALIKELDKNAPDWRKTFTKEVGLKPENIARATIVLQPRLNDHPLVILTTVKAYDQKAVRQAILKADGEEKTHKGKTYYAGRGDMAVYHPSDRVLVVGSPKVVEDAIEHDTKKMGSGVLTPALKTAVKEPVVMAADVAHYGKEIQKGLQNLPNVPEAVNDLFKAKKGLLTIISGKDTRATVELSFANAEDAKAGEKGAKEGLKMLDGLLDMARQEIAKGLNQPGITPSMQKLMQKADDLLKETQGGLKAAKVTLNGKDVVVKGKIKSGTTAFATLVQGLFGVAGRAGGGPVAPPPPPPPVGK